MGPGLHRDDEEGVAHKIRTNRHYRRSTAIVLFAKLSRSAMIDTK